MQASVSIETGHSGHIEDLFKKKASLAVLFCTETDCQHTAGAGDNKNPTTVRRNKQSPASMPILALQQLLQRYHYKVTEADGEAKWN